MRSIRRELEVGVLVGVSVRAVPRAVWIDLDRRVCPEITADFGGPPKVVGGIIRLVIYDNSNALHADIS